MLRTKLVPHYKPDALKSRVYQHDLCCLQTPSMAPHSGCILINVLCVANVRRQMTKRFVELSNSLLKKWVSFFPFPSRIHFPHHHLVYQPCGNSCVDFSVSAFVLSAFSITAEDITISKYSVFFSVWLLLLVKKGCRVFSAFNGVRWTSPSRFKKHMCEIHEVNYPK